MNHPAKFSPTVLDAITRVLETTDCGEPLFPETYCVLDPFAGTGRVHELDPDTDDIWMTYGIELEPEWAAMHPRTEQGDATAIPWTDGSFDAVVTSPPYGNRMADSYAGDGTRRHTYRIALGRDLTDGSVAGMQWGRKYAATMKLALSEIWRVLKPGGLFLLNVSDHVRSGTLQGVPAWYASECATLGFVVEDIVQVDTPRNRNGANADARADYECLFVMRKP